MLSVGDGANDVAMIQAADVGVGIIGKEGRQAVNNADFAISQFRFLVRLLLVHGSLSAYRLSRLIKYSFYKNVTFAFMLFYFQFYCGFSGGFLLGVGQGTKEPRAVCVWVSWPLGCGQIRPLGLGVLCKAARICACRRQLLQATAGRGRRRPFWN